VSTKSSANQSIGVAMNVIQSFDDNADESSEQMDSVLVAFEQ